MVQKTGSSSSAPVLPSDFVDRGFRARPLKHRSLENALNLNQITPGNVLIVKSSDESERNRIIIKYVIDAATVFADKQSVPVPRLIEAADLARVQALSARLHAYNSFALKMHTADIPSLSYSDRSRHKRLLAGLQIGDAFKTHHHISNLFAEVIRAKVGVHKLDFRAIAADFEISRAALAQSLGLQVYTLYDENANQSELVVRRVKQFLSIMARVEPWAGDAKSAIAWYRNQPIPSLGRKTAEDLVRADQGTKVDAYLDVYESGGFA
jgi:hypothetical protein